MVGSSYYQLVTIEHVLKKFKKSVVRKNRVKVLMLGSNSVDLSLKHRVVNIRNLRTKVTKV